MSAGRSSQLAACFSVERTKYLMFSKSMPDRSEPQAGIGLPRNSFRPFSRRSSIHCRSSLRARSAPPTPPGKPPPPHPPPPPPPPHPHLYPPPPPTPPPPSPS